MKMQSTGRNIMNRRTTLVLTFFGLAIAVLPKPAFAQAVTPDGIFQLNVAKSKYNPGPPPKSVTLNYQAAGKVTAVGFDADGNPFTTVFTVVGDGKSRPVTGSANYDATAYTQVDPYTLSINRTKAGEVVETGSRAVSQDGKTVTITAIGTDANGRPYNNVLVYEKQ